jgi:hypothetical protein
MKDKPDITKIKEVAPEASDLEEIGSGDFKVVYKAQTNSKMEAVKLVQIPSDENDRTISGYQWLTTEEKNGYL